MFNFPVVIPIAGLVYLPSHLPRVEMGQEPREALRLVWFVPASLGILLLFFPIPLPQPTSQFVPPVILIVMCSALYRSAKALVPLNMASES